MNKEIHIGVDVHKEHRAVGTAEVDHRKATRRVRVRGRGPNQSIAVAVAEGGRRGEVRFHSTISNDLHALEPSRRAASETGCDRKLMADR